MRGEFRPSPGGPPVRPALGQWTDWGLCPAGLQSPPQGHSWSGGCGEPLPHPCLCYRIAVAFCRSQSEEPGPTCHARHPVFGWPEEPEGQLGWMSGSLSNDGWAGCGNLALRQLPTKICLLLARTKTLEGKSCALGPCPFSLEQRITFIW